MMISPFSGRGSSSVISWLLAACFMLTLASACFSQPRDETLPADSSAPKKPKKPDPFEDLPRIVPEPIPEDSLKIEEKIERREKSPPREPSQPEPVPPAPPGPIHPPVPPPGGRFAPPDGSNGLARVPLGARLVLVNGNGGGAPTPPVEKDRAKEEALRANLVAIIRLTCREFLNNNDAGVKNTRQACELLSKEKPSDEDLTQVGNLLFQVTGMTLDQLKTELSRTGTTEFVQQMHEPDVENLKERWNAKNIPKKIPIEQTGSRTVSLDGRDDTLDIEHSAEFKKQDYTVGNTIHLSREEVISSVADKFCEQGLVVSKWPVPERVEMVMLPDGQKDGKAVLYYTYKMEVVAKKERVDPRQKPDSCSKEKQTDEGKRAPLPGQEAFEPIPEVPYLVYIDAQSNKIRELRPLLKRNGTVEALGWTLRR